MMAANTYEWRSDFAHKYVGIGREEGREEGRQEGLQGVADSVIAALETRGFIVSDEVRLRINSRTDLHPLKKWIPKAVTVDRPEDLFT